MSTDTEAPAEPAGTDLMQVPAGVARLQQRDAQANPVLVDYSIERGHSPVLPLSVRIDALVRRIAFLCWELRMEQPLGDRYEETRV